MLMNSLSWIGKLPNYSDFVRSRNLTAIEDQFMQWFTDGQQHVGEQVLHSEQLEKFVYYFSIRSSHVNENINFHGVLFSSHDARGRLCPFIVFSRMQHESPASFVALLKDCFRKLNFDIQLLLPNQIQDEFYNTLTTNLLTINEDEMLPNKMSWVEIYPRPNYLFMSVERLSPILYRKLIHR